MSRAKLIYIIPKYQYLPTEHAAHHYELLQVLGKYMDVYLIVLKGDAPDEIPSLAGYHLMRHQETGFTLGKVIEFLGALCRAIKLGYRNLYSHYSDLGAIFGSLLLRPIGGKTFYWHCYGDEKYFRSARFAHSPDRHITALALRLVSYYVAGTRSIGMTYAKVYQFRPEKIVILPNGINLERFKRVTADGAEVRRQLGIGEAAPVVLFVHPLESSRGVHNLPAIADAVVGAQPEVSFVIVGEGSQRAVIERALADRGLLSHFKFVGKVPNVEVPAYYSAADVFIMPSETACFPRVVLEAMATQTPMVVTDVGGVREMLPEAYAPFIIPVGEWQAFVDKVVYLLQNREDAKWLTQLGLRQVRHRFSLDIVVQRFVSILGG